VQDYVKEYWLDYDDLIDVFNNDAASHIEVVFEGVPFFEEPAEAMYDDFVTYKNEQPHLFTKKVNLLILETSRAIAHSYSGLNKSELIILSKLEIELNRI
jgi:hypothetical protein